LNHVSEGRLQLALAAGGQHFQAPTGRRSGNLRVFRIG
jgi:hypothetical protein